VGVPIVLEIFGIGAPSSELVVQFAGVLQVCVEPNLAISALSKRQLPEI
jgi:hypothetical protein